jgi:carbamoyltransferase
VANGRIEREGPFERLWVQPAAGDAGGAVGAALVAWHTYLGQGRTPQQPDGMSGARLGPAHSDDEMGAALVAAGLPAERVGYDALPERVAALLAEGKTVGWFQGRMEFGPRALGARSVLADPRDPEVQRRVNLQVKFRESFRPFAPAVLAERAADWFALDAESPYMLLVAPVRGAEVDRAAEGLDRLGHVASAIPAVTHVDGSARIQTVDERADPLYRRLLEAFEARTGCPVLVNTSYNVRAEPIVGSPADAVRCFLATHVDVLALGPFLVEKDRVPGARQAALTAEAAAATYGLD